MELGTQPEASQHIHQFHIVNNGNSPIAIRQLSANCDCALLIPDRNMELQPKESITISATLRLRSSDCAELETLTPVRIAIRASFATLEGAEQAIEWHLIGFVRPNIRIRQSNFNLGMCVVDQMPIERVAEIYARSEIKW